MAKILNSIHPDDELHYKKMGIAMIEKIKNGKVIETSIEENAVWELMYFGKSSADIKYKSKKSHN